MTKNDARQELANAFGRDLDPLAQYADTFEETGIDPFAVYVEERLSNKDLSDAAVGEYHRTFREWKAHMDAAGRHPACPNEGHVKGFIDYLRDERDNASGTVKNRLMYLNTAYEYWQDDAAFPHPTDYNPIQLAKDAVTLNDEGPKEPPRLTRDDLQAVVSGITHLRDRAIVMLQLKLGLRATEVCNIRLSEIQIQNNDVLAHYDDMGTASGLQGRTNAIYIPHDRDGNKSRRPRVLPLDDELRAVLTRYLLIRPDNGEPWLFLSKNNRSQLRRKAINKDVWKAHFHPEYAETEDRRAVTSHFGRHWFTTYWRVKEDVNEELVKYMRGDTTGGAQLDDQGAIRHYLHTYYEDIEGLYRERIFKLNV
jgi:integrase/recombinase XerD